MSEIKTINVNNNKMFAKLRKLIPDILRSQLRFTCSKSQIEKLGKCLKHVQSYQ